MARKPVHSGISNVLILLKRNNYYQHYHPKKMKNFDNDITASINVLHNGGIILYPTDTIWGIGCDATNANAIRKIYKLKNREEKKSMIILLAHENEIKKYVSNPSKKIIDFISIQKKPTTAIFENAIN